MLTRRSFLHMSGLTVAAFGAAPAWLLRAAEQSTGSRKVLVTIFQRGAADGLNIVVPFSERRYYEVRPGIAIQPPGMPNGAIDLDGRFGFHPSLRALEPLWRARQLAIVHAAGSPDTSRSHFDAQAVMESGTPAGPRDEGWLNRALPASGTNASPMRAVAVGTEVPLLLRGGRPAVAVGTLSRFRFHDPGTAAVLERRYASTSHARLRAQGAGLFDTVRALASLRLHDAPPASQDGVAYTGEFGRRLRQLAQLLKADVGVEVACVDSDGWDHHAQESGLIAGLLTEFGSSLAAFARDLGDRMEDVVVVTMSEFGRTVAENGTSGTDHGHGSVMMVLGGPVRGGRVHGAWPGLEPEQLFERRDLAVTTDFRDVLAEVTEIHLGRSTAEVFPGYDPVTRPGLIGV